jgi:hypothetical protein
MLRRILFYVFLGVRDLEQFEVNLIEILGPFGENIEDAAHNFVASLEQYH